MLIQWKTALHCNVASHWMSPYPEWSLQNKTSPEARFKTFSHICVLIYDGEDRTTWINLLNEQLTVDLDAIWRSSGVPNELTVSKVHTIHSVDIYIERRVLVLRAEIWFMAVITYRLNMWAYMLNKSAYIMPELTPWRLIYVFTLKTSGLILGLRPANERRRYFVTTSLIGWAQAYNQPWYITLPWHV